MDVIYGEELEDYGIDLEEFIANEEYRKSVISVWSCRNLKSKVCILFIHKPCYTLLHELIYPRGVRSQELWFQFFFIFR